MTKADWIWMPHAGHYICGEWCRFHLCTYVNGYIVSTVGDYMPDRDVRRCLKSTDGDLIKLRGDEFDHYYVKKYGYEEVGCGRLFETMVFPAEKRHPDDDQCCPYKCNHEDSELEMRGYNTSKEATEGHYELCFKYDEMNFPAPKIEGFQDIFQKGVSSNDLINMMDLAKAIKQFNQNVESIKAWMSAQGTHNSLFIERIGKLESQIKNKVDYKSPFDRMPF